MPDPLISKLRRPEFAAIAELQDRFVELLYSFDNEFVMHGGTAIWRCYNGNRFSYDIDGYIMSALEEKLLSEELTWKIAAAGMRLKKIRTIGGSIFATISDQDVDLQLELIRMKKKVISVSVPYEKLRGDYLTIRTLAPENFILEKIDAYSRRRYERDLYDIYQLINRIVLDHKLSRKLRLFVETLEPPLENNGTIEGIILTGVAPSFNDMVHYISNKLSGRTK